MFFHCFISIQSFFFTLHCNFNKGRKCNHHWPIRQIRETRRATIYRLDFPHFLFFFSQFFFFIFIHGNYFWPLVPLSEKHICWQYKKHTINIHRTEIRIYLCVYVAVIHTSVSTTKKKTTTNKHKKPHNNWQSTNLRMSISCILPQSQNIRKTEVILKYQV